MNRDNRLDTVIGFLLDDSKWGFSSTTNVGHVVSRQEVKRLEEQIAETLKGSDISFDDFNLIYRHIAIENVIEGEAHIKAERFLQLLRHIGVHRLILSADESRWIEARDKMGELLSVSHIPLEVETDCDLVAKGKAIKALRCLGYEIPLKKGRFEPTQADSMKFGEAMRYRFGKIGAVSIGVILANIRSLYRKDTRRYDFCIEPAMFGYAQIIPPWGYLLNVALSFACQRKNVKPEYVKKIFEEILELSCKYFTVLELQPLSRIKDIYRSRKEIVDELEEGILYNQHIALDQYPLEDVLQILKDLECARTNTEDNPIIQILEWICRQRKENKPETLRFTHGQVEKELSRSLTSRKIAEVLDYLTIRDSELNSGYCCPSDVWKRNYYKRPLVLIGGHYVLFDTNIWAKGFYHVWLERFGGGNDIGHLFELVLQRQLGAKNVQFIAGQKYLITAEERKSLGLTAEEGECDLVIDTDEKVYFVELKKKEITGRAMAGDGVAGLTDMAKSLGTAFVQAAKHEIVLRYRGDIEFVNGDRVVLGNKRVEKIHISSFDRYGLHDKMLVKRFLESLVRCDFSCSDGERLTDFKKIQGEFRSLVSNKIVSAAYPHGSYLLTFRSFSLPQFMFALDNCQSGSDFSKQIDMTSRVITGLKDWYDEQVFMTEVRKS